MDVKTKNQEWFKSLPWSEILSWAEEWIAWKKFDKAFRGEK